MASSQRSSSEEAPLSFPLPFFFFPLPVTGTLLAPGLGTFKLLLLVTRKLGDGFSGALAGDFDTLAELKRKNNNLTC